MNIPPTQEQIDEFYGKFLSYPEARKRMLKDYFHEELREIEHKSDMLVMDDIRFNRLVKVVEWILTQI